jgi:hypothetical protein
MKQVPFLPPPPTDSPAFLEWVRERLNDISNASAENVFEPETLGEYATNTALTDAITTEQGARATGDSATLTSANGYTDNAIAQEVSDRNDAIAAAVGAIENTITEAIFGMIAVPTNKDYLVCLKFPFACTITETTVKSLSGTCAATFKINTTALGGAAHAVSSTEEAITRSSANAVAAGDDLVITVASNASCLDFSFCIKTTRTIS